MDSLRTRRCHPSERSCQLDPSSTMRSAMLRSHSPERAHLCPQPHASDHGPRREQATETCLAACATGFRNIWDSASPSRRRLQERPCRRVSRRGVERSPPDTAGPAVVRRLRHVRYRSHAVGRYFHQSSRVESSLAKTEIHLAARRHVPQCLWPR